MIKTPRFVQLTTAESANQRAELIHSLAAPQAWFAPKFLYNALGSKLFEAITCVPEYYPTRTEQSIFNTHRQTLSNALPHEAVMIDLGAGNCQKAASLFDVVHPVHYVAVDISVDFLASALETIQREHPHMSLTGLGMDFSSNLALPVELELPDRAPRLFFYPGSSISNFTPAEALAFLKQVNRLCRAAPGSGLLIGVDLVKDKTVLEAAYDDGLGVTAAFNRNSLLNINAILGSNFEVNDWAHQSLFNEAHSRIEMHLQAKQDLVVTWPEGQRAFRAGQTIHTENSYKWLESGFEAVLHQAGFGATQAWMDENNEFSVIWAA